MKRLHILTILAALALLLCCVLPTKAEAATSGYYTYTVSGGKATITDCDTSISGNITIPSTLGGYPVTSIGDYAFYWCSRLTAITIPDSVTSIDSHAFYGCSSLTSITIPDSVTSIGSWAFSDCSRLTSITIPDSVTSIGNSAFDGCSSLTGITVRADNAHYASEGGVLFNKEKTLLVCYPSGKAEGSYKIPDSVTSIGDDAFSDCSRLTSITIPDSVTSIGDDAFYYCSSLTSVTIGNSVTSIGNWAFSHCRSLTSITIPDSVTSIGGRAFYNCSSLTSVTIGNSVTSIGDYAFSDCSSLTSITIPVSVTSIGEYAFLDCSSLTSVTIGNGVTSIGNSAFRDCSSLTSITIPDSVTSIGSYAFDGCSSLTGITVRADNAHYASEGGVLFNKGKTLLVRYPSGKAEGLYKIPDSVTSIGSYAFYNCSSLTSITIPDSVTSIGSDAFYNCSSLTSVTIGNSVTRIGNSAFDGCSSLTSVTIGNSVTSIGTSAFSSCSSLTSITIPDSVTSIGGSAFYGCSSLTSITIPDSVTSIGERAFYNCSSLTSITIPDSVTSIGHYAFQYCRSLTAITIPDSVTSIGGSAFRDCSSLTTITIPDSVTSIGGRAFYNCSSLTSITIPDGVTSIGDYAFYNCSSLTSITIPDGVTSIGDYAFRGCSGLQNITIPGSVTNIGKYAFQNCSSLTSVTILEGVSTIGNQAFGVCSNLKHMILPTSLVSVGEAVCSTCKNLEWICYAGTKTQYNALKIGGSNNSFKNANWSYEAADAEILYQENCIAETGTCSHCQQIVWTNTKSVATHNWVDATCTAPKTCALCQTIEGEALGHSYSTLVTAPTCTDKGYTTTTCTTCNDTILSDYVDALGHSGDLWFELLPATCTEDGIEARICDVCKSTETRVLIATHHYQSAVTAPNCTEKGFTTYTCEVCGDSYISDYVDATGHNFGAWTQIVAPTCVTEGEEKRVCVCGEIESRTAPIVAHSYGSVVTAPACTEKGFTTYTCEVCGDSYISDYVDATGHNFGAWTQIVAPTCVTEGEETRVCVSCGESERRAVPIVPHSYSCVVTAPTCTEQGFTTNTCTVCGDSYISDYVDATGHSFSAWVQAIAPGCTVEGSEERTCACGNKESQTIPALGHDYSAEVTAPTCTEKGFTTKICSACGDVAVTDYVDAKGHGWSAWVEIKASTCTVEGTQVRFCNCGARENAPTQKKPHSYDKEVCTACGDVAQYDWVLTENTAVNRTLAQDLYVDLNGFDLSGTIITNGFKVYGKDSTTDGYTCDSIGYFTCVDENGDFIVPERICAEGGKQYMAICTEDRYSFHRFFVGITHMTLAPEAVGLGYKSAIYGDEMVFAELAETKAFTFCVQLEGYNPVYRRFNRNELTSGAPLALRIRNYDVENYSEHNLYAQVSLTLKDGTVIEAEQVSLTFRWLAEQVSANYTDYTDDQLASFKAMLQVFDIVKKWNIPNLI